MNISESQIEAEIYGIIASFIAFAIAAVVAAVAVALGFSGYYSFLGTMLVILLSLFVISQLLIIKDNV